MLVIGVDDAVVGVVMVMVGVVVSTMYPVCDVYDVYALSSSASMYRSPDESMLIVQSTIVDDV